MSGTAAVISEAADIELSPPLRVLLVDDDDLDRMATRRALAGLKDTIEITEAVTAGEALAELHRDKFDCVLLDYLLPDSDGLSVLEYLSGLPGLKCAVIMLTGEGDEEVAARAIQAGAHDYIRKRSLTASCLRRSMDNALEKVNLRFDVESQRRQLERRNQELEQYAYVISHDLQEPLRAITSFVQLLQQRYESKLDETADQYIGFAVAGARRMHEMIGSLLELSRIGRDDVNVTNIDIADVVGVVQENLSEIIQSSGAIITCEPMPSLNANNTRMVQLFQNLVSNSVRYRSEETPRIRLFAEPLASEDWHKRGFGSNENQRFWQFCVEDNGIGIDPKFHDRVFGIFQRLHDRETYDGAGIGLSLCKKIVENYMGRIWFESSPGEGTRFYFTLPEACSGDGA